MTLWRHSPNCSRGILSMLYAAGSIIFLVSCGKERAAPSFTAEERPSLGMQLPTKRKYEALTQSAAPKGERSNGIWNDTRQFAALSERVSADNKDNKGDAVATAVEGDGTSDGAAAQLYEEARTALDSRQRRKAIELFRSLEDSYPHLDAGKQAQLGVAYAHFLLREYKESIEELDRFITFHPAHKDIDYAYYLKAVNYYEQIPDHGRDSRSGELALEAFQTFLRRFPDSKYAADASFKARHVAGTLATNHLLIGRFYQSRDELLAAIKRFHLVVRKYPNTTQSPEALYRLVECFTALGVADEARQTAQVLASNNPGSDWAEEAGILLASVGLSQEGPTELAQMAQMADVGISSDVDEASTEIWHHITADRFVTYDNGERRPVDATASIATAEARGSRKTVFDLALPEVAGGSDDLVAPPESRQRTLESAPRVALSSSPISRQIADDTFSDVSRPVSSGFRLGGSTYKATSSELALLDRWNRHAENAQQDDMTLALKDQSGSVKYSFAFEGAASRDQPEAAPGLTATSEWNQFFAVQGDLSWSRLVNLQFKNELIDQRNQENEYIGTFKIGPEQDEWQQNRINSSTITIGLLDDRLTSNTVLNTSRYTDSELDGEYVTGYKLFQQMDLDVWRGDEMQLSVFGAYGQIDEDYNDFLLDDGGSHKKKKDPFSQPGQASMKVGGTIGVGPTDITLAQIDSWDAEDSNGVQKTEYETTLGLDLNNLISFTGEVLGEGFWNIAPDYVYASFGFGAVDMGSGTATEDRTEGMSVGANWNWSDGYGYLSYWQSYYDNRQSGYQNADWAGDGLDFGGGIWGSRWTFDGWISLNRSEQMGEWSEATDFYLGGGLSMSYKPDDWPDLGLLISSDHYRGDYVASDGTSESGSWVLTFEFDFTKYWAEVWAPRPSNLGVVLQIRNDSSSEKWGGDFDEESNTNFFVGLTMGIGLGE